MNMHVREYAWDTLSAGLIAQEKARLKAEQKLHKLRKRAEAEVERLLVILDTIDGYTLTEREEASDDVPCDTDELEPSLGSFDRATNQITAWQSNGYGCQHDLDTEADDCDREDADPAEESEVSGIGDMDGLMEATGGYYASRGLVEG